ncbi:MAG: peptidoglycan-binding protein, partial [Candidatus Staskawiczbacteria bacterium]|nr:peptidoglycan-binding protein [Candidatus Staskawiczbacteria bacterium]
MKIKFLLVTAVLVTAILGFGFAVSAQTPQNQSDVGSSSIQAMIVQLQAQIASLMAQIQALQTQQNGTQQWCHTFNTNLGFINSGSPEVSNLYGALIKEGIVEGVPSENIRTDYGEETASYVIKFQAKYGIMQSGYVGPLTRAKLNTLYGCAVNPICTPNWQCQWGVCANGSQSKVPVDSNNCGQQASSSLLAACSRQVENCAPSSTTQPTVTLTAAGGATGPMVQVQSGASIDLRWTSVNANNGCSISSTPNDSSIAVTNHLPANSTITVRPITSTTYTVTCYYVDSNYQTTQGSNSITLQVASPTAQPSIKVISPNGGEILPFGMPQVSWTSSGVTNANIYLQFPDGATCFIKTVPASQGSDIITILNGFQCPNISRTISAGQYKIFIIGDSDSGPRDFSDNYFNFSTAN